MLHRCRWQLKAALLLWIPMFFCSTQFVIPLSTFSPGALQSVWEKTIARKCIKLSKEVHWLNKKRKKLEVTEANKEKLKIN